jgi:nuclear protein localization family protein 4
MPCFDLAARPSSSAPQTSTMMDEDIPPEVFDQIAAEEAARMGAELPSGRGGVGVDIRICPHCTYENTHGGTDCEVCGLPL